MPTTRAAPRSTVPLSLVEEVMGLTVEDACEGFASLTPRQQQVAELMAQGVANRAIAEEMGISEKTLAIHRADVFDKLQTQTSAGVARVVWLSRLAEEE